jgi:hypothetical protein
MQANKCRRKQTEGWVAKMEGSSRNEVDALGLELLCVLDEPRGVVLAAGVGYRLRWLNAQVRHGRILVDRQTLGWRTAAGGTHVASDAPLPPACRREGTGHCKQHHLRMWKWEKTKLAGRHVCCETPAQTTEGTASHGVGFLRCRVRLQAVRLYVSNHQCQNNGDLAFLPAKSSSVFTSSKSRVFTVALGTCATPRAQARLQHQ